MKKMIVGNLKMNLNSPEEREKYLQDFKQHLQSVDFNKAEIVLCVPAIHLEAFAKEGLSKISIGAQNIYKEEKGSFTGEISASMVANAGAQYVIIGHSERRKYFAETNADANLKIKAALKNGLNPIYCVGETKEERQDGTASQIIVEQISEAFADLTEEQAKQIVVAYEPVWAVGSDNIPTSDEILQVKILLKKVFVELYGLAIAEKIRVLYGGSVKAESIKQLCVEPAMDGVLVGRESLVPADFLQIVKALN